AVAATGAVTWKTVVPLVQTAVPVPLPLSAIVYVPTGAPAADTSPDCGSVGAPGAGVALGAAGGSAATRVAANAVASAGVSHWPAVTVAVPAPPSVYVSVYASSAPAAIHAGASADVARAYCR